MYGKQACAEWIRFFWKESPSNTLAIRSFDISNTQSHNLKDLWPTTWVSSYSYSVKGTAQRFQRWGRSMSCSPLGLGQVETWHHDTPVFPSPKPLARDISCKGPESVWTRWVLSETARSWNLRQTMTDNRNCSWHLLKNMKLLICITVWYQVLQTSLSAILLDAMDVRGSIPNAFRFCRCKFPISYLVCTGSTSLCPKMVFISQRLWISGMKVGITFYFCAPMCRSDSGSLETVSRGNLSFVGLFSWLVLLARET